MSVRYAYLGPEGTFTEAALRLFTESADIDAVPFGSVPAALEAVRAGDVDAAVVAMENSIEGAVNATIDELATGAPLQIRGERLLGVTFSLLARCGTTMPDVKRVITHPHAHAQCRGWLAANLPDAEAVSAASTAAAAAAVAEQPSIFDAAIAAPIAAEHYGLVELASGVGDRPDGVTRFVLVTRPTTQGEPTGADRSSLVAFIADDHPGALLEILSEFAVRGVNLTRIESRPTGAGLGRYCFSIDCEGHIHEARVGEALMGLKRVCPDLRFLGSYPRADGTPPRIRQGTSDADFDAAKDWLTAIRRG